MFDRMNNPPLKINVRIFDIASDKEESKRTYDLRKPTVRRSLLPKDIENFNGIWFEKIAADYKIQKEAVDKKIKSIIDTIIWAMNHGKSVEFISAADDAED